MNNDFVGEFKKQRDALENLYGTALDKQRILIEGEYENLYDVTKAEEKILMKIQNNRGSILSKIREITNSNDVDRLRYDDILRILKNKMESDSYSTLENTIGEMKDLSHNILRTNKQNMHLISFSKQYIDETMAAIFTTSKKSILDRKV
ncbi:MAG: flagellar export chaperone FlgN [Melioribacteraceae bacterium]|nr:flagellar export chaperone FlgN [Melioribacteraceae bacterium]MCF8355160.1 flagellar export chaperone FlgN [Melioribacteraceae bacterium]MCF8392489.1 flagellar export chaperone FlgN [Melioribacteraceae bacterium]MCF8418400.1 flagellar export chaperone FlgN [Melioribacteraceae bacterium]